MPHATREQERKTEDEIARRKLGPRGVPGGHDTAKMTPQIPAGHLWQGIRGNETSPWL